MNDGHCRWLPPSAIAIEADGWALHQLHRLHQRLAKAPSSPWSPPSIVRHPLSESVIYGMVCGVASSCSCWRHVFWAVLRLRPSRLPTRATAFLRAYPDITSHMWTASPYRPIPHARQARYGMLWTSSRALKFHKPYLHGIATPFPNMVGLPSLWPVRNAWSYAWWLYVAPIP